MAARAAIALCLTALAWAGTARAQDNPACAQYREPMAYNACLAQHGPKANGVGQLHGGACNPATPRRIAFGTGTAAPRAQRTRFTIRKAPSASMDVYIWSFGSIERGLLVGERGARARGNSAGAALFAPRCGRSARGPRFAPGPEARQRGILILDTAIAVMSTDPSLRDGQTLPVHDCIYDRADSGCDRRHTAKKANTPCSWKDGAYLWQ